MVGFKFGFSFDVTSREMKWDWRFPSTSIRSAGRHFNLLGGKRLRFLRLHFSFTNGAFFIQVRSGTPQLQFPLPQTSLFVRLYCIALHLLSTVLLYYSHLIFYLCYILYYIILYVHPFDIKFTIYIVLLGNRDIRPSIYLNNNPAISTYTFPTFACKLISLKFCNTHTSLGSKEILYFVWDIV